MKENKPFEEVYRQLTELLNQVARAEKFQEEIPPETLDRLKELKGQVEALDKATDEMLEEAGVRGEKGLSYQEQLQALDRRDQRLLDRFRHMKSEVMDARMSLMRTGREIPSSKEILNMFAKGEEGASEKETKRQRKRKGIKRRKRFRQMGGDGWMSV